MIYTASCCIKLLCGMLYSQRLYNYLCTALYNFSPALTQQNKVSSIMRLKADLLLFMVAVIWGTGFITQGVAARYQVAYLFNGVSFMLAAVILIPFIPRGTKISADQWKWIIIAGLILCLATGLQQVGLFYTQVANAGFLTR